MSLQEQKSQIRLIRTQFIEDFVKEFETKIKEGAQWLKVTCNLQASF